MAALRRYTGRRSLLYVLQKMVIIWVLMAPDSISNFKKFLGGGGGGGGGGGTPQAP